MELSKHIFAITVGILALIDQFLSSIRRQTHESMIYAMRQGTRGDNLTVCYRKKQIDVGFSCVCPVIDNEFRHNIVKVAVDPLGDSRVDPQTTLTVL